MYIAMCFLGREKTMNKRPLPDDNNGNEIAANGGDSNGVNNNNGGKRKLMELVRRIHKHRAHLGLNQPRKPSRCKMWHKM